MTTNYINKTINKKIGTLIYRRLNIREITKALIAYYYELEPGAAGWLDKY